MLALALQLTMAAKAHLVFSGGAQKADAERALASWQRLSPMWSPLIELRAGFPRVAESASVPGLKPGFFVLLLGVCDEGSDALDTIKALYPGAYERPAPDGTPTACPTVRTDADQKVSPVKVQAGSKTAVANVVLSRRTTSGNGPPGVSGSVGVVLVDRTTGAVLDLLELDGESEADTGTGPGLAMRRCAPSVTSTRDAITVAVSCRSEGESCNKHGWAPKAWVDKTVVTITNDRLTKRESPTKVTEKSECRADWGEEGD